MSFSEKANKFKTFILIGLIAVGIDYFIYRTFVFNQFSVSFSKSMGFVFGTSFSFIGNRRITFNSTFSRLNLSSYFLLYFLTLNLNVFLNNKFIGIFSDLEFSREVAFFFATAICAVINFIGLNYFVFRNKKIKDYE